MSNQARKLVHSDIKPENPRERAAHYLDVPNMPWEATKFPGIKIKVLYTDDSGITTALFKLDPGAVVPLHEHTALEQTYVIEGSLEDHEGQMRSGPIRLAARRQSARSSRAERRSAARLFSQAKPFRLRRKILHRAGRASISGGPANPPVRRTVPRDGKPMEAITIPREWPRCGTQAYSPKFGQLSDGTVPRQTGRRMRRSRLAGG